MSIGSLSGSGVGVVVAPSGFFGGGSSGDVRIGRLPFDP